MGWDVRTRRRAVVGLGTALLASLGIAASPGCSKDDENSRTCPVGTEGCPCTLGGACDPGLACYSNRCVEDGEVPGGGAANGDGGDGGESEDADGGARGGTEPGAGGASPGGAPPGSGGEGEAGGGAGGAETGSGGVPTTGGTTSGGAGTETGGAGTGGAETGGADTGGAGTGGEEPTTGGAETGGAETGGAETGGESPTGGSGTGGTEAGGAAGAGGAPPALTWLTCANDTCCFDYCTGQECGVREFTSCTITLMDGAERSICGDTAVCQDDVVILPAWFTERECVFNWMEGNYSPGSQAHVFGACPCEIEGRVVTESVHFVSAEGGNVCDFAEVPDPACASGNLSTCL